MKLPEHTPEFQDTVTKMTTKFGRLYRSDGGKEVHRKLIKSWFCNHEYEKVQYSTSGGWMADIYEGQLCTKCGKRHLVKVY
ncbi:hypothetical protein HSE3_gp125 [Bacillus phage vB_BceM-HSE3]|nr:hypothetical protein HSE3_gp125 [Bacillus phage vB_BceM-HSE3]